MSWLREVFGTEKPIIAMCHLHAMPGDPSYDASGGMKAVVDGLIENGDRMKVKIIIGGAPTSQPFADDIGADWHAINAQEAVKKVKGAM